MKEVPPLDKEGKVRQKKSNWKDLTEKKKFMTVLKWYHTDKQPNGEEHKDWRWFCDEICKILTDIYET